MSNFTVYLVTIACEDCHYPDHPTQECFLEEAEALRWIAAQRRSQEYSVQELTVIDTSHKHGT